MNKIDVERKLMDRLEMINTTCYSDRPLSVRSYATDNETIAIESTSILFGTMVKELTEEFNNVFFDRGELVIYD